MEEIKIRKVTKKEKIIAVIGIALFLVAFIGLYLYLKHFNAQIMNIAVKDSTYAIEKYTVFVSKAMVFIKIIGMIIGIYFFYIAFLTFKTKKFPPDNIPIIRDVKIVEGKKSIWLAYLTILYGILIISISFYIPYILQVVIDKLLRNM